MDRASLLTYARRQFGIQPSYEWAGFRDDCVLKSPSNGQWFALFAEVNQQQIDLAGQQDISIMEVRYDDDPARLLKRPGIIKPVKMSGHWIGVILDEHTDEGLVHRLLSRAFTASLKAARPQREHLIHVPAQHEQTIYHDAPIPQPVRKIPFAKQDPQAERLRQMQQLYDYTISPLTGRATNFVRQGQFMADFTIDKPTYHGQINRFYTTYHDLSPLQLESYFGWRTKLRHGQIEQGPLTFAYLYLYEVINQIGVESVQAGYQKLQDFAQNGLPVFDNPSLTKHLHQWQRDYVVYYQLDQSLIHQEFAQSIAEDQALIILLNPSEHSPREITQALRQLGSYHLEHCPLDKKDRASLEQTVAQVWLTMERDQEFDLAKNFLGWPTSTVYRPFGDAVFLDQTGDVNHTIQVDDIRTFTCQRGQWRTHYYLPVDQRAKRIGTLLHEIDRLVRQTYHCGRQLTPKPFDDHLIALIKQGIQDAHQQIAEARRPKIKINLSHLDQIRSDASITKESLLTDEERQLDDDPGAMEVPVEDDNHTSTAKTDDQKASRAGMQNEWGLTEDELYLLVHLLKGQDWQAEAQVKHWLVSVLADNINEKLFDEIGDTVIEFDDQDQPRIVEDYFDDVRNLLSEGD